MARRFRRLRQAASQVIEVTRRFCRFCSCCGTMRTCYGRDVIPVSVAISCTNLPPARAPILCCHSPINETAYGPCVTTHSSSVGPQHWIRPTDSGPQSNHDTVETHKIFHGPYMPGSFSSDYQVTPSGMSFTKSDHKSDFNNLRSQRWRSPPYSVCAGPVPIWSISGRSQTDDQVPFRFLQEPRQTLDPVCTVQYESRTSGSSGSALSPSDERNILSYEFEKPARSTRPTTSRAVNRLVISDNGNAPVLTPVEIPSTSFQHVERIKRRQTDVVYAPQKSTTDATSSDITLVKEVHKVDTNPAIQSSRSTDALAVLRTNSSTIALPGCSQADPELRLKLNFLKDTSSCIAISPEIRVEFSRKTEWTDVDPQNWHHRKTLARTNCGAVTLVFCDKFHQDFVLKALPTEGYNSEVEIMQQCQSPFVAEMQAMLTQGEDRLLCMSYYERSDLSYWLRKDPNRNHFTEHYATLICSYVLTGLEFIHNKGYLHLDIKPGNILLGAKGYPVIGDFGSARNTGDESGHFRRYTPSYASPEVLRGDSPNNQADLWSTACVFYEVVVGRSPYKGQTRTETEMKILACATPDVSMLSLDAQHFICAQIKSDKTDRLGFSFGAQEVTTHRIFHSMNWDRIKYGHRHSDCGLLKVLRAVEQADAAPRESSSSSLCNSNNNRRWELWSSSSSEGSDEEFGIAQRVIYTVQEEDEELSEPRASKGHDDDERVQSYGQAVRPYDVDDADADGRG